jgi:hypothetical protein
MELQPFDLQQAIQRFIGELIEGLLEAVDAIRDNDPMHEQAALRRLLVYFASSLDIASGPQPTVNLLDMQVFVRLSRETLELYWKKQLGDRGQALVTAFEKSEARLLELSKRVLSSEQQHEVSALIECWRSRHTDQVRVEWVRFNDFAELAAKERASTSRGLFGGFKSAVQSADQALMLAERAMFLANRLPFLIRLQLRLGVQETIDDSLARLPAVQRVLDAIPAILRRSFGYLVLLGVAWSAVFWGGYYLVK